MIEDGRNVYVIISAGGAGTRMAAPQPKQFLRIGDKTILETTVERYLAVPAVDRLYLAVPAAYLDDCGARFAGPMRSGRLMLVSGGAQRQDSVANALAAMEPAAADADLVLVHDGVRPYVTQALIETVTEACARTGAVIPAVPPRDTIRHETAGTLEREKLRCVQTPQGFRYDLLREAYRRAKAEGFYGTDDAGLVERLGVPVTMVPGDPANKKITLPEDLPMEHRIGTGFDVHALTEGRRLILGGVEIPFALGLAGHSDADVLVHALMDAMLGAAALGDIGKLFPDSEEAYRGISSLLLLSRVNDRVQAAGYTLENADVTVICQRPKLADHIPAMRARIAETLGVETARISVKATTTERLGFTGRGEGIAAEAVCMLQSRGCTQR